LAADDIFVKNIATGVNRGIVLEEYPDYAKGRCVLALQKAQRGIRFTSCGAFQARRHHQP
jgi:hypothetical protein